MEKLRIVTIDGPVASGKTAVGRALALRLACRFLDTGLMYRAITWKAVQDEINPADEVALQRLAEECDIQVLYDDPRRERVFLDTENVTDVLREAAVERCVSLVSSVPGVRRALVAQQRRMAAEGVMVVVGRDIGTVVLPNALLKVYLEASVEERAHRRHSEMIAQGQGTGYKKVFEALELRDRVDSQREYSPLRPAKDASRVDTDDLTVEEVVERIMELWRQCDCG